MFSTTVVIVLSLVYGALLLAYMIIANNGSPFSLRAFNKFLLSAGFNIIAIVGTVLTEQWLPIQWRLIVGLIFCFFGDMFLLKSFSKGGFAFGIGNIFIFGYLCRYMAAKGVPFSGVWFFILLTAIPYLCMTILDYKGIIPLKNEISVIYPLYIISVSLHGTLSLVGLFYLHDLKSVLLMVGSILFMVSDIILWINKFKYSKGWFHAMNSLTYFTGMFLIALSASIPFTA